MPSDIPPPPRHSPPPDAHPDDGRPLTGRIAAGECQWTGRKTAMGQEMCTEPATGWVAGPGGMVAACEQHATHLCGALPPGVEHISPSYAPPSHVTITAGQLLRLRQLGPGDEVAPELLPAAAVVMGRAGYATRAGVYSWAPQGGWEQQGEPESFFGETPPDEPSPDAYSNVAGPPPWSADKMRAHIDDLQSPDKPLPLWRPADTTNMHLAQIATVLERAAGVQELHIANWPDPSAPARFTGPCEGCGCRLRIARGELAGICPGCGYDPSEEPRARPPSTHPPAEPNSTERQLKADLAAAAPPDGGGDGG